MKLTAEQQYVANKLRQLIDSDARLRRFFVGRANGKTVLLREIEHEYSTSDGSIHRLAKEIKQFRSSE